MNNFSYYNPVRIEFGRGTIAKLAGLLSSDERVLMVYGGGSIKKNGVYDQAKEALAGRVLEEFGGVEANPQYETLMRAVEVVRSKDITFILAVGGGVNDVGSIGVLDRSLAFSRIDDTFQLLHQFLQQLFLFATR